MRLFYSTFRNWNALRSELTWTHYRLLLSVESEQAREWYMNEAIADAWSSRQLERQISTMYYERLLASRDKVGKLTHGDIGQRGRSIRMFDAIYKNTDDNSTLGIILCSQKNEAIVKYSVLNDAQQIFASRYPTADRR